MPSCPSGTFLYTIKANDSLWLIANQYGTTIQAIANLNPGIDINRLHIGQQICVPAGSQSFMQSPQPASMMITLDEADLNNYLRLLWEQHVYWTRLTIVSMVFDLPDVEFVTNRLLQNPEDFGALLSQLYGEEIANQFTNLFTNHLVIAAEAGDNNAAADAEKRWYANADEIAAFLASINPYWSQESWRSMLYDHLAMTKQEAVDMLTQNYADSIATFDNIERQALEMADMMTTGIVNQFPDIFMS